MAFPASQQLLVAGLQSAISNASQVKELTQQIRDGSLLGDTDRQNLISLLRLLDRAITEWAAVRSLSGIGAYAQDQFDNMGLDIVAEFTAMEAEAILLRDWIFAAFPKDIATGAWLVHSYDTAGKATSLVFTSAELSGFRSRADDLLATIA
jgi:hypothetical protein